MRIIECVQGDQVWAEARRGVATASRFNDIMTPSRCDLSTSAIKYACELVAESHVPSHYWVGGDISTIAMENGRNSERPARKYFELITGNPVVEVGFIISDDGRFGVSPDGLVGADAGLELKCPTPITHVRWLLDGVLPVEHLNQVHGGMIVTGRRRWHWMSYSPSLPPLLIEVHWSEYTDKLKAKLDEFLEVWKGVERQITAIV